MMDIVEKLKQLADNLDKEAAHGIADDLLCEALRRLGQDEIVDEYANVGNKWYA